MTQTSLARRRNGLSRPRTASGPLPLRILKSRALWVFVAFTAVYVACLAYEYATLTAPIKTEQGETPGINDAALWQAASLAWPTLAVWIVLYLLLDRLRPQRLLLWWIALGWGGAVATAASLIINSWAADQMQIVGQDPASGARSAIFVAPFVEEATKASVLFLVAILWRHRMVSRINAVALAGLSAAGFAFTENIIYYARAIVFSSTQIGTGDPEEAVAQLVRLRGAFLAFGHPLFTTMTAVGLLAGLRSQSKTMRVLAPLVGYGAAALLHMAFNTGATFVQDPQAQLVTYFLVVLPLVLSVVIWVLRQLPAESRRIRARLADYHRFGWLPDADPVVFSRGRSRWRATLIAASRGWRTLLATLGLQRRLTELAYLEDAQTRGVVDAAGAERAAELLAEADALRPAAVADPRGEKVRRPNIRAWLAKARALLPRPRRRGRDSWSPVAVPLGSARYSPVDPRWGPPQS